MTRQIKFRFWDGDKMSDPNSFCSLNLPCLNSRCWKNGKEQECNLMQFTGLYDKNEKEIYEGDIVKVTHSTHGFSIRNKNKDFFCEVIFSNGGFRYRWPKDYGSYRFGTSLGIQCEVVGNIYSNPEILRNQ